MQYGIFIMLVAAAEKMIFSFSFPLVQTTMLNVDLYVPMTTITGRPHFANLAVFSSYPC